MVSRTGAGKVLGISRSATNGTAEFGDFAEKVGAVLRFVL
jgi:hypothetical protein